MSQSPEYDIEITHVFDAPPERVYRAFTDPAEFARWYGPPGFPVDPDTMEFDARVGGRQHFAMVADLGRQAWEMMFAKLESMLRG